MALDTLARAMAARADSKAKTAYQYAVEGGYTGTEEQFTEDMGKLGINAEAVDNAVRFDIEQSKTALQKLQAQANIGLDTTDGDINAQLAMRALINGSYADLTAGNAEALVTNLSETSLTPYNFQTTGGSVETGNRVNIKKVIYGSVVVNQLVTETERTYSDGPKATFSNGVWTFGGTTPTATRSLYFLNAYNAPNHVLYVAEFGDATTGVSWRVRDVTNSTSLVAGDPEIGAKIVKVPSTCTNLSIYARITTSYNPNGEQFTIKVIDLTQWFGSTETADHIYLMESASAGRGVSFMQTQYPVLNGGYIPHNTGTLLSSNPSKHEGNGFNWFDGIFESGDISASDGTNIGDSRYLRSKNLQRCVPSATFFYGTNTIWASFRFYDVNKNFISGANAGVNMNTSFTIPSNAYYFRFVQQNAVEGQTCISDHWDDTRNGDFEEWALHSYPIDNTVDGHGIFKFKPQAASPWTYTDHLTDEMYVDGDELIPDGTFTKRWELHTIVADDVLDTSTTYENVKYYRITKPTDYVGYNDRITDGIVFWNSGFNAIYDTYSSAGSTGWDSANNIGKVFTAYSYTSFVFGFAVGTTLEQAKAALVGKTMMYLLTTPTTSAKDPYQETMIVDNWGWEILNDYAYDNGNRSVQIPVGTESVYPVNLVDKLEAAPDNPTADGFYIVKKNSNSTEYVAYVGELPSDPASDGTYTLKATVSSGSVTKSWVADT